MLESKIETSNRANESGASHAIEGSGSTERPLRVRHVGIFGCPLDTGNFGVSALGLATLRGLHRAHGAINFTMFDHGRGVRVDRLRIDDASLSVRFMGCHYSRRFYSTDNTLQLLVAAKLGLKRLHPTLRRINELDAALDISGGDSFSDIYGMRRFRSVSLPKTLAIKCGIPLVLLPQTYGPFRSRKARRVAEWIVRSAAQVWARDDHSLGVVRELLAGEFDPERHRSGVDVALGLPAVEPADSEVVESVRRFRGEAGLLVGLNVSGLLYNDSDGGVTRFGLMGSYQQLVRSFIDRLLTREDVRVLLVPHVAPRRPSVDCDITACAALYQSLDVKQQRRTLIVRPGLNPMEIKWVIGQCEWFCGTRMHACIAALSQGVPTAAVAYSDKTRGVFETAGIGDAVVDPRRWGVAESVDRLHAQLEERDLTARQLKECLPALRRRLDEQFEAIASSIP